MLKLFDLAKAKIIKKKTSPCDLALSREQFVAKELSRIQESIQLLVELFKR